MTGILKTKVLWGRGKKITTVGLKKFVYLFLAVATPHIPSTAMVIAGATVPPVVPTNKIHAANARQMIPTMNLSFLIYRDLFFSVNLQELYLQNISGLRKTQ